MGKKIVVISKEELYDLYWNQKLSMRKIAKRFGCGYATIRSRMIEYDICRRTRSEIRGELSPMFGKKVPKETLEKRQKNRVYKPPTKEARAKMSQASRGRRHTEETKQRISKLKIGHIVSEETRKKMSESHKGKRLPDETRKKLSDSHKGEKSHSWRGGISFEPYCPKFNEAFKESIREKFGRVCFLCPTTEEENGRKLSVHHVDYNKNCGCDDAECVLVPLCQRCHSKTNHNREYWVKIILNNLPT